MNVLPLVAEPPSWAPPNRGRTFITFARSRAGVDVDAEHGQRLGGEVGLVERELGEDLEGGAAELAARGVEPVRDVADRDLVVLGGLGVAWWVVPQVVVAEQVGVDRLTRLGEAGLEAL